MKIAVLGGSGFLGSHVCDQLYFAGHHVRVFDCVESPWLRKDQEMIVGEESMRNNIELQENFANTFCPISGLNLG